jgi:hypothetical protein
MNVLDQWRLANGRQCKVVPGFSSIYILSRRVFCTCARTESHPAYWNLVARHLLQVSIYSTSPNKKKVRKVIVASTVLVVLLLIKQFSFAYLKYSFGRGTGNYQKTLMKSTKQV